MKNPGTQTNPFRLRLTSAVVLSLCANTGVWAAGPGASRPEGIQVAAAALPAQQQPVVLAQTQVAGVEFDDVFMLRPGGTRVDISRFNHGNVALPGDYRADLYINQAWMGRANITLRQIGGDSRNVQACFDRQLLERIGIDLVKLSPEATAKLQAPVSCTPLSELVPSAVAAFDNGEQRLDISVPQASLSRQARGYVDPMYWDDGITAARLGYNASVYHNSQKNGFSTTQSYLGVNAGVNVGAWRFRHTGSLTDSDATGTRYQSMQTNVQRGINMIKSQLTIGDAYTDGTMMDSVGFRGIQLASDDRMYPESQRGYAPTVRGIANTNARVQVRQSGNIIYETTVAPGPFEINDLYPTGYGGDLEVIVTEADGSIHVSKTPYAAAVNALRPGVTRYSAMAGQYRAVNIERKPMMAQAQVQHGFTNTITGYGGAVIADGYYSVVGGAALNTDWGAFSADVTQASAAMKNEANHTGQSVRLAYSKLVAPTNTNLTLAAYRYSSSGFLSLADAMQMQDLDERGTAFSMTGIQRNRFQVTLNQMLAPGFGSVYASGYTQDYWNREGSDTQYQVGYNNFYKRLNYGVSAARQYDPLSGKWDNRIMLTLGIPLGVGMHAPYSMTSVSHDSRNGDTSLQESVTGSLGVDNAFSYGVTASHSGGGDNPSVSSGGANVSYASPFATLNASGSRSSNYTQSSAGVSGSIVAYSGGVVFSPFAGDTMAIVEAKDAAGARVTGGSGLRVDPWGRAVISSLAPFSRNQIEIDPKGLPLDVELKSTEQYIAPTSGAVVKVKFETQASGRAAIIGAKLADGSPAPFGAEVFDMQGNGIGTVAQGGRIIARGLKEDSGKLSVAWGKGAGEACTLNYALPKTTGKVTAYTVVESQCN